MGLDAGAAFRHCLPMSTHPLMINGDGNTACVTALALVAAGFTPHMRPPSGPLSGHDGDKYQSVLALSPSAKTMLETLAIWPLLAHPTAMVCDMAVFGSADDWHRDEGLSFADRPATASAETSNGASDKTDAGQTIDSLAHIVSLADLTTALAKAVQQKIDDGDIITLPGAIDRFDAATGLAGLSNGETVQSGLLIDCARTPATWRQDMPPLAHDYAMSALVGSLHSKRPHGQAAIQIFQPDGPLAFLPLADAGHRAMIWSMPHDRARALAAAEPVHITAELMAATQGALGTIENIGPLAVQPLSLKLSDVFVDRHLCLLGEACHVVHPMAGQGFNLSLRDAALLADCLYDAKALGLPAHGPHVLADFSRKRRSDAALTAALTHGLAGLFSGPAAKLTGPLGRFGLKVTGQLARHNPKLRRALTAQADSGLRGPNHAPRLMRGRAFS